MDRVSICRIRQCSQVGDCIFGYLKPHNSELKLKHVNEYKAEYCTLCYGLRKNLGFFSSLVLNYESTFLYIFLSALYPSTDDTEVSFRCPVNPLKKRTVQRNQEILEYASFVNYHLFILKLEDGFTDTGIVKRLLCKALHTIMSKRKKYLLLRAKYQTVADATLELCRELYALERERCDDYDLCSQTMGDFLMEIVNGFVRTYPVNSVELVLTLAKHLGMWTYLIDAYDDYENDKKSGSFNPLIAFEDGSAESSSKCLKSAEYMLGMMVLNLTTIQGQIEFHKHGELIENIISLGTRKAVQAIKIKREGKKNDHCCK